MIMFEKATFPNPEEHKKKYGDWGELPPNFTEISASEFAQSKFFTYSPDFWEYRQINKKEDYERFKWGQGGNKRSHGFAIRMAYFYDGTGFAMAGDYWGQEVRYFKFAPCFHEKRIEKKVGNCLHEYTCQMCGFVETIDSSD